MSLKTIVTHKEVTTLHNTKGNEQDLDQYLEVTFELKETIVVQEEVSTLGHTSRSEQDLHQCLEITRKLKEKTAAHKEVQHKNKVTNPSSQLPYYTQGASN